jgi:DNA-binding NarL/FixJ family response regulator
MATIPDNTYGIKSQVRILVVEDHEKFRHLVVSKLQETPQFQIVGQACDGLDAVHKAEKLQPDLILLDIGLPSLNGLDAARRIRTLSPESKILFLSQESSVEVVQIALNLGALGYLLKADAGRDLLEAIDAISRDEKFVSAALLSSDEARV